jgi:hypothetical protein
MDQGARMNKTAIMLPRNVSNATAAIPRTTISFGMMSILVVGRVRSPDN